MSKKDTVYFGLGCRKQKEEFPVPPAAWVYLKKERIMDNKILITNESATFEEFASYIDYLINELEIIKEKSKPIFYKE